MGCSSYEDDPRPCKDIFWNDLYVSHTWRCAERNAVIGCSLQEAAGEERRREEDEDVVEVKRKQGRKGGWPRTLQLSVLHRNQAATWISKQSSWWTTKPKWERERDSLIEVSEVMMRQRRWEIIADASFFQSSWESSPLTAPPKPM